MASQKIDHQLFTLAAKTIGMLAADAVEKANSGHPGMPMGAADCAVVLWLNYLRFNPQDPKWLARDRFVLSNGHGCMLLYSLLHLCGYDLTLDDIKAFRQFGSRTPGHPECHMTPGVECTTGPLGQGISNAVGMAIGQKVLSTRYGSTSFSFQSTMTSSTGCTLERNGLFDHHIFCLAGDGCLMEGVSSEACSLAGHLGLGNLIVIYDDNHISIAGDTKLAFTEDVLGRYRAYGWDVSRIDGHNFEEIDKAISQAIGERSKPSLIAARTIIGKGSPNKANTHEVHGAALGKAELELTKKNLDWPLEPPFYVPEKVKQLFASRIEDLKQEYDQWQQGFSSWKKGNAEQAARLEKQVKLFVPADLRERLLKSVPVSGPVSTRKLSSDVLQVASAEIESLLGGSADLEPSTLTLIKGSTDIQKDSFSGKNLRFGVREHGMGSVLNGLSYYGSFLPYGSTFLVFSDYMRPPIRLAAISHLPTLFIFTHESVFLGEDGPTHQPVEHLGTLRAIPNLFVFRPADAIETAVCYSLALSRRKGPSALAFTRQNLDPIERAADFCPEEVERGAYPVFGPPLSAKEPEIVLIATGSEVSLAIAAAKELDSSLALRVVSMPCWELFMEQSEEYRMKLIPKRSKKVVIEAAATLAWPGMLQTNADDTLLIGIDHYGASAPAKDLAEKFGFTPKAVVSKIRERFKL